MELPSTGGQSADADTEGVLKRSRVAIYLQLAELFRNRIISGHWPVDSQIPRIEDLADEFGVARGTIRQAFDTLENEGLVERKRAKGSFVRRRPAQAPAHALEMDWAQLLEAHLGSQITTLVQAHLAELPDVLGRGLPPVAAYRRMVRLHRRDGEPFLLGTSFLDDRLYRQLPPERFEKEALLYLLQELAGNDLGQAQQVLTIATADVDTARHLDISVNAPVAVMRRSVLSRAGELIYASEGLYRGDRVMLEIALR
ncbi:GntR family transcriptional regulator [Pseudoruegeria sp. HB172150]|uniref:GntR family transcriptional regulator n=1 Tax=Pseudoruegeria sp. HB172150 TaxID=2721164 RepID=UPI0015525FDE|nr:GntR family transcriptional regulator [Pseudoruegeria sp. HB172150]